MQRLKMVLRKNDPGSFGMVKGHFGPFQVTGFGPCSARLDLKNSQFVAILRPKTGLLFLTRLTYHLTQLSGPNAAGLRGGWGQAESAWERSVSGYALYYVLKMMYSTSSRWCSSRRTEVECNRDRTFSSALASSTACTQ